MNCDPLSLIRVTGMPYLEKIGLRKETTLEVVVDWSCCTSPNRLQVGSGADPGINERGWLA